ncbi:hypothetical protein CAPTEDRAFT_228374 [Capitella teleta]|uniref:Uncharacterized protein n=1 Tax=Capitella teleta TaxID=283909 RepID=R7UUD1_CAPTE|nr:hypothetical protein CAPTEDRAFT_228374 [Capitella teleta]|eukprot:ELU10218.1 hypothetical protein CAPTEDRAFT_228374 [Capitella teleta]
MVASASLSVFANDLDSNIYFLAFDAVDNDINKILYRMQTVQTSAPVQGSGINSMVKSGFGGVCAVYLTFFGIFLCFASIGLFVTGSFAEESGMTIAGIVIVVLGVTCIAISIGLCVYLSKQMRSTQGTIVGQPVVSGMTPVVTGMSPPQAGYPQAGYPQAGYPPMGAVPAAYPMGTSPPPQQGFYPAQQQPGSNAPPQAAYPPQQPLMTDPQSGSKSLLFIGF